MDQCRVCGNHVVASEMLAFSWKQGYKIQVEILPHGIPWSGIRCVCDTCAESIAVAIEDKRRTAAVRRPHWKPGGEEDLRKGVAMENGKIIAGLQELRRILVKLNADEVDDPEDCLMALANREDLIEILDETIRKVEHPPIVRG